MIEVYVILTLLGLGYIMNQLKDPETIATDIRRVNPSDVPSHNNVYHSTAMARAQQEEVSAATESYQKSVNGLTVDRVINRRHDLFSASADRKTVSSQLAGVDIPQDQFIHNNMVPFYRGSLKENTSSDVNVNILENYGALTSVNMTTYKKKKEVEPFFAPQMDIGNVFGTPNNVDKVQDRYTEALTSKQNNVLPFQQVRVGPGLNQGFCANAVGGFQQFEVDELARSNIRSVDDLRVANKPRETFEGVTIESGIKMKLPGKIGQVKKNRPDTFYEQTSDMYFHTTGAFTKPMEQPEVPDKPTAREETSSSYSGNVHNAKLGINTSVDAVVKEPFKDTLPAFDYSAPVAYKTNTNQQQTDYGKSSIMIYKNERDVTSTRTYQGNLTTLVKAFTAPILDALKVSKKEYNVEHPRQFGSVSVQIPKKITVKDTNDIARTTIKETLIHDATPINLVPRNKKTIVYNPKEIAKTTVRQTLKNAEYSRNVGGSVKRNPVYNPNSVAKTTLKETTIDAARDKGNVGGIVEKRNMAHLVTNWDVKDTQKAELADIERYGVVDNIIGGGTGYEVTNFEVKDTQKQDPQEYFGVAVDANSTKPTSYDNIYNARVNETREDTLVTREPQGSAVKVANGVEGVNMDVRKMDCDTVTERATMNIKPPTNTVDICVADGITRTRNEYVADDRLDIGVLSSLKDNPFAISVN
jgi:hypothetical protein